MGKRIWRRCSGALTISLTACWRGFPSRADHSRLCTSPANRRSIHHRSKNPCYSRQEQEQDNRVLRPESTLSVVIARSATQLLRREATQQSRQAAFDHSRSAGGILIGKRVGADRIAIVAATDPGP